MKQSDSQQLTCRAAAFDEMNSGLQLDIFRIRFSQKVKLTIIIIISSLIKQLTECNRDNQQTTSKCL